VRSRGAAVAAATLAVVGAAAAVAVAQAAPAGSVPAAAGFPESIAVAPGGRTFYVSSFTTGAVYRGTVGSAARPFLPAGADGRSSAAGVKVGRDGRLFVITGSGRHVQVFDDRTGRLEANLGGRLAPGANLNDLALAADGDIYVTDFATPRVYRVSGAAVARRDGRLSDWLAPSPRVVPPVPGASFNGIVITPDQKYLVVGQTGNGALYRVEIATRQIRRITGTGSSLGGSDGMVLVGRTLYVALHRNAVAAVQLDAGYSRARAVRLLSAPSLDFPTSVTVAGSRLLVLSALKPTGATGFQISSWPLGAG
jgi:sugar lactone lactonase YvrE